MDYVVWLSWGVAAAIVAGLLGVLGYAFGTFVSMRPHTTERAFGLAVRELARETFVALFTQPLLPAYYLVGRKLDDSVKGTVPVVFVHGYMQNRVCFIALARALARKGIGPLYGINYPWFASLASNGDRLGRFIDEVRAETGASHVDLVCHSMGGLVALEMMRRSKEVHVRRCVTIATPHAGVIWRGPMLGSGATSLRRGSKLFEELGTYAPPLPMLSVYSTHDNLVHPKETSQLALRGGRDVEVEGLAHLAILFSPEVADHVAAFLL